MGEIDTKPIEPVQVALTHFGERGDHQKRCRSSSKSGEDIEKDIDVEGLLKDLANYKVQLEAKESAYLQLLVKLEHHQTTTEELCSQLKSTEAERDAYIEESREARTLVEELEPKVKEMADQLSETGKIREQLSHALSELKAAQGEVLVMETELASAKEVHRKALMQAELAEIAAAMEKERAEDLLKHVAVLNETVLTAKMEAIDAEKEKCMALLEKDAEIEQVRQSAAEAQEQVEEMRSQLEMMKELEDQLLAKSLLIDSLQAELNGANQLVSSSEQAISDATINLNELKADLEDKEIEDSNKTFYIEALEAELNRLKLELNDADDKASSLNCDVQTLTDKLQKVEAEMEEIRQRENEAQVEIPLLKAELHEGRSKLAAATAAEARAESMKSGFYLAVQQLAVEAEEAKKENIRLKRGEKVTEESDNLSFVVIQDDYSQTQEISQTNDWKAESDKTIAENHRDIAISLEEYESLIMRAEKAEQSLARYSNQLTRTNSNSEIDRLKELEAAMTKIGEFRTRAEQAATRAEAAEKAKMTLEDQINRWREHKQRRKAALAALREESSSRDFSNPSYSTPSYDTGPKSYQPLYKVLNMKF